MQHFAFFPKESIIHYLTLFGKGVASQDYELIVSLALTGFCEQQFKEECVIGLKVKDEYSKKDERIHQATISEIATIIRDQVDKSTDVDLAIVPKQWHGGPRRGPAFQLKRIGRHNILNTTNQLVAYLNNLHSHYPKTDVILMLIFEYDGIIELKQIADSLMTDNFPFSKLMFMAKTGGIVSIGELFPKRGSEEYSMNQLI